MEKHPSQKPLYKASTSCLWVLASIITLGMLFSVWFLIKEVDEPKYFLYFIPIVVAIGLLVYYAIMEISKTASNDNGIYN